MADAPVKSDPWSLPRSFTAARIGLTRTGDALGVAPMLDFQMAHARARDAVRAALDPAAIAAELPMESVTVRSRAGDRSAYLRRPDLGRLLDPESVAALPRGPFDIVFVVADGLSATAVHTHAAAVLRLAVAALPDMSIAPVVIATQARVALADEIGERIGATLTVILLGERPGLTTPYSLGIYVTFGPRSGRQDSERNCISNIHARGGLSHMEAAAQLTRLVRAALGAGVSGVGLDYDGAVRPALT